VAETVTSVSKVVVVSAVHQATVEVEVDTAAAATMLLLPPMVVVVVDMELLLLRLLTVVLVDMAAAEATATPADQLGPGGKSTKETTHLRFISDLFHLGSV